MMRTAMKATTPPTILMMRVSSLFRLDEPAAGTALLALPVPGLLLEEGLSLFGGTDQIISGSVIVLEDEVAVVLGVVGRWLRSQIRSSSATSTRSRPFRFSGETQ
jgi:hypothetical protein